MEMKLDLVSFKSHVPEIGTESSKYCSQPSATLGSAANRL